MEKYKRVWNNEKFVVSGNAVFYEERVSSIGTATGYRHVQVQPIFQNEFWEVYALHCREGIFYAIVGLYKNKRIFYEKDNIFSATALYFKNLGCDLGYTLVNEDDWKIMSGGKTTLKDVTPFLGKKIANVDFKDSVLELTLKNAVVNQKVFFVQTAPGEYHEIAKKNVSLVRAQWRAENKKQINHRTF